MALKVARSRWDGSWWLGENTTSDHALITVTVLTKLMGARGLDKWHTCVLESDTICMRDIPIFYIQDCQVYSMMQLMLQSLDVAGHILLPKSKMQNNKGSKETELTTDLAVVKITTKDLQEQRCAYCLVRPLLESPQI